jgi:hypothetical protein
VTFPIQAILLATFLVFASGGAARSYCQCETNWGACTPESNREGDACWCRRFDTGERVGGHVHCNPIRKPKASVRKD